MNIRLGTVTEFGAREDADNNTFGVLAEDVDDSKDDHIKFTARHLTGKIVKKFDQLMRDSHYKVKKGDRPKFHFDKRKVADQVCDTYIDSSLHHRLSKEKEGDPLNMTALTMTNRDGFSRRSLYSERVSARMGSERRGNSFKVKEARDFEKFCRQVEAAFI